MIQALHQIGGGGGGHSSLQCVHMRDQVFKIYPNKDLPFQGKNPKTGIIALFCSLYPFTGFFFSESHPLSRIEFEVKQ